jgi:hypothetical protein
MTEPVPAELVPAIPLMPASCPPDRDHRDKPGDDGFETFASTITRILCGAGYAVVSLGSCHPVLNGARGTPGNQPCPRPGVTGEFWSHQQVTANTPLPGVPRAVLEDVAHASPGAGSLYAPLFRPPAGEGSRGFRLPVARVASRRERATADQLTGSTPATGSGARPDLRPRGPDPPQRSATLANAPVQTGRDMRNIILVGREVKGREFCYSAVHDKAVGTSPA